MDGKLTRVEEQSPRRGGVATATRQGPAEPAGLGEREEVERRVGDEGDRWMRRRERGRVKRGEIN